jgi:hypothetical protein
VPPFQASGIQGKIGLDESPAIKALDRVEREARAFKTNVDREFAEVAVSMGRRAQQGGSAFGNVFDELKGRFGKKSFLGEALELAAGTGAVAGLGLAAEQFANVTGKIADLSTEVRTERMTYADAAADLARSIPVLGGVVRGFDNIREAVTGEKAALMAETAAVRESEEAWKFHNETVLASAAASRKAAGDMVELRREFALLSAGPGQRDQVASDQNFSRQMEAMKKQFQINAGFESEDGGKGKLIVAREALDKGKQDLEALQRELAAAKAPMAMDGRPVPAELAAAGEASRSAAIKGAQAAVDAQITHVSVLAAELNDLRNAAKSAESDFEAMRQQAFSNEALKNDWEKNVAAMAQSEQQGAAGMANDWADNLNSMAEEGRRLQDEFNPAQKIERELQHVQDLFLKGFIDDPTFDAASKQLQESLGNLGSQAHPDSSFVPHRSVQAEVFRGGETRINTGSDSEVSYVRKQNDLTERTNAILERLENALARSPNRQYQPPILVNLP